MEPNTPDETFADVRQDPIDFIEIGGQKVPLHLYLKTLNRHDRRAYLARAKKENLKNKNNKKVIATRADSGPAVEAPTFSTSILEEMLTK